MTRTSHVEMDTLYTYDDGENTCGYCRKEHTKDVGELRLKAAYLLQMGWQYENHWLHPAHAHWGTYRWTEHAYNREMQHAEEQAWRLKFDKYAPLPRS